MISIFFLMNKLKSDNKSKIYYKINIYIIIEKSRDYDKEKL